MKPHNMPMRAAIGSSFESQEESDELDAWALCEPAVETLDVKFPDRRMFIKAENVSLRDAYDVVAWFVRTKAFEPGTFAYDLFGRTDKPHDECNVRSFEPDIFVVSCQFFQTRAQREPAPGGFKFVRYAEAFAIAPPSSGSSCRTKDNLVSRPANRLPAILWASLHPVSPSSSTQD